MPDNRGYMFGQQTAIRLLRLSGQTQKQFLIEEAETIPKSRFKGAFFVLLEDMPDGHGSYAWCDLYNWTGYTEEAKLYNWGDPSGTDPEAMLDGAKAGYWGQAQVQQDRWTFEQGPCIDEELTAGVMTYALTLPTGTVSVAYSYTPTVSGLNNDIGASGLPAGLSISATTGVISGTPTTPGDYGVTITATAPKTGASGNWTLTRYRHITIEAA